MRLLRHESLGEPPRGTRTRRRKLENNWCSVWKMALRPLARKSPEGRGLPRMRRRLYSDVVGGGEIHGEL